MAWSDPFLLGPLGAMRPLPSPPHGSEVKVTPVRRGGVREPLLGAPVADVWSIRRRYEFEWDEAYAADLARLRRGWYGLDRRPRRLLDPMHGPNLLSLDASTTGAYSRSLAAFDAGARPMTFVPSLDLPVELEGSSGLLRWSVPDGVADNVRADLTRRAPRVGRPVCVSLFARGTGSARATVTGYDPAGAVAAGTYLGGTTVALTSTWQRTYVVLPAATVPSAESVAAGLYVPAGTGQVVETCGWQLEHATAPSPFEDGGGCPRVRLADLDPGYKRLNRRRVALALEEV